MKPVVALRQHLLAFVARTRRATGDARGMTLMELIVSMTIMGLVILPLTEATIFFLRHGQDATAAYQDDNGLRSVATYFDRDGQSATAITLNDASPCGGSPGEVAVATFGWTSGATAMTASWFTEASGSTTQFVRRRCSSGTVDETNTLAPVQGTPTVTCTPNCGAPVSFTLAFTGQNGLQAAIDARSRVNG
jgi:prepilin-type N-terminal cleavage/methylation domain-containing protein